MKNEKKFNRVVKDAWEAIKTTCNPKYHAQLRNVMLKLIAEEDKEFADFVELMKESGWDYIAAIFQQGGAAARELLSAERQKSKNETKQEKINKELAEIWDATKPAEEEDAEDDASQLPIKCEYCGNVYPLADLSGSKKGLVCYKCRQEMENRD